MYDNITLVEFDLCLKWVLPNEKFELKSVVKILYACCVLSKYVTLFVILGG